MNKLIVGLFAAGIGCAAPVASAQAVNLISNGGFESGTTLWKKGGAAALSTAEHTGTFSVNASCRPTATNACFGPTSTNYMMQSISSVPGTTYTLSFWARTSTDVEIGEIGFNWDGAPWADHVLFTHSGWHQYTFSGLIATDTSTEVKIYLANHRSGAFTYIDDVEVYGMMPTVPQIPEPSTAAMLIAGLGLLGYATRRRAPALQT